MIILTRVWARVPRRTTNIYCTREEVVHGMIFKEDVQLGGTIYWALFLRYEGAVTVRRYMPYHYLGNKIKDSIEETLLFGNNFQAFLLKLQTIQVHLC